SRSTKSIEFPGFVLLPAASVRITIPASAAAASKPRRTAPRTAFILFIPRPLSYVQLLAHDDHPSFSFLFRLRQPRNNCSKFIEYLVPALYFTAIFRALHGFISNEGEFRLAVS